MKQSYCTMKATVYAIASLAICYFYPSISVAQDPSGYPAVARWTLNDSLTDGVEDTSVNGIYLGEAVTPASATTDTPANPDSGKAIELSGGYLWQGGGNAQFATFLTADQPGMGCNGNSNCHYDGSTRSRSISMWMKFTDENINSLNMGEYWTAFFHGAVGSQYPNRPACQMSSTVPEPDGLSECRDFAVMVVREANNGADRVAHIKLGSTQGGGYLFSSGDECDVATGDWVHVVAIYSEDAYGLGLGYNVRLFVNGSSCGTGLIPRPYTDVTASKAHWFVSAQLDLDQQYAYQSAEVLSSGHRVAGKIDDVRFYDRVLSPAAITWLKNNSGK